METVDCNLCGLENYRFVYSMPDARYPEGEWFTVVECQGCGLGFVNPRPTYSEMSNYYPAVYYGGFDEEKDNHKVRYQVEGRKHRYQVQARYVQDASAASGGKVLLDVGCANGDFPRYMQKLGWQVEGVEVFADTRHISDFKIYTQEFTQIPVSRLRYDVVTAWAVLEHVHNPMGYFEKAAEVLKTDGAFIFLVTNFESASSRYFFREDIPRHLYFFTESTIREYLARSGLELTGIDHNNNVYEMRPSNWLYYHVYRYLKRRKLEWKDLPPNKTQYFAKQGLHNNLFSNVKYVVSNPLAGVDRALTPVFEKYQLLVNNYGIVTYTAIKR